MCFLCHPLPDIKVIPQDILCKHQLVGEKEKEKTLLYDRKAMRQAIGNWWMMISTSDGLFLFSFFGWVWSISVSVCGSHPNWNYFWWQKCAPNDGAPPPPFHRLHHINGIRAGLPVKSQTNPIYVDAQRNNERHNGDAWAFNFPKKINQTNQNMYFAIEKLKRMKNKQWTLMLSLP